MSLYSKADERVKSNQSTVKARKSAGKPKIHLLPAKVIKEIAEIITEGSAAHEGENWLKCKPEEYIDALGRHLLEVMADIKSVNKEDGPGTRLNAAYLAANAVILLDIINHQSDQNGKKELNITGNFEAGFKGLNKAIFKQYHVHKKGKKSGNVPRKKESKTV